MFTYIDPKFQNLIDVVKFMQQLKKHKGSLFIYKIEKLFNANIYFVKSSIKNDQVLFLTPENTFCFNSFLIKHHPYIGIFNHRPRLVLSMNGPHILTDKFANFTAECEWLRAQIKYPPLAKEVRDFERNTINQRKDSKTYLSSFFQIDRLFLFYQINIPLTFNITSDVELETTLIDICNFRIKLISTFKNNYLIDGGSHYLWKLIVVNEELILHLLLVEKHSPILNTTIEKHKDNVKNKLVKSINQAAETAKITIGLPKIEVDQTQDAAEDKRKTFNNWLKAYFKQSFWFPLYQIPCKRPRKILFGKGNDRDENITKSSSK